MLNLSTLDSEFFTGVVRVLTFFSHAKFEVKKLSEFFHLQSTLDSGFFAMGVLAPTFFGHTKFEVKNFFGIFKFTVGSGF